MYFFLFLSYFFKSLHNFNSVGSLFNSVIAMKENADCPNAIFLVGMVLWPAEVVLEKQAGASDATTEASKT